MFWSVNDRRIKDFWAIPMFDEVMKTVGARENVLNPDDPFRKLNKLSSLFEYNYGDITGKDC